HAWTALGPFVTDDDHITRFHLITQNAVHGIFLAFENAGLTCEGENAFVHAGRLDDAAIHRQIPVQHGQAAVLGIGVFNRADAAVLAVGIEFGVISILAEGFLAAHIAR